MENMASKRIIPAGATAAFAVLLNLVALPQNLLAITKKPFDFVVGVDGNFKEALAAAGSNASSGKRFYLFFPAGEYAIGTLTGDGNQMTTITTSNISFIGEGPGSTTISNKARTEGISITATLYFNRANNLYLQDLTVLNKGNYGDPAAVNQTGRYVAIQDRGDKNIYKKVPSLRKIHKNSSKTSKIHIFSTTTPNPVILSPKFSGSLLPSFYAFI